MPEYKPFIFVWTSEAFLDEGLCFALERLGYESCVYHEDTLPKQLATIQRDTPLLFVIGPHMPIAEVKDEIEVLRQRFNVEVLFLVRNTPVDPTTQASLSGREKLQHQLPLDLHSLQDTIQDIFPAQQS